MPQPDDSPSGISLRVRDAVRHEAEKFESRIQDVDFIGRHGVSIFVTVVGATFSVMALLGTYIYGVESRVKALEVSVAEARGLQQTVLENVKEIASKGSITAQRTEVVVMQMSDRLGKMEDFMSRDPRFTAEDAARLERRIEKIEGMLSTHIVGTKDK